MLSLLEDVCCLSLPPSKITFQSIEPVAHLTALKHVFHSCVEQSLPAQA